MVSDRRGARRARDLASDASGLSTVEYILVLVLLAIAAILLWRFFGSSVEARIDQSIESVDTMNTAGGGAGGGMGGAGGGGAGGGAQPVTESGSSSPTAAGSMGTSMGGGVSGTVISGRGSAGSSGGGGGGANPAGSGATASAYVAPGTDDERMDMFGMVGIIVLIIGFAIPFIVVIKKTRSAA